MIDREDTSLSIVIPTRGCSPALDRTLLALAPEARSRNVEVVVVFDGLAAQRPLQCPGVDLRVLHQPPGGPARARNLGASVAAGRSLLFLDDDCLLEPGFLAALQRAVQDDPRTACSGTPALPKNAGIWSRASHVVTEAFIEGQQEPDGGYGFLPSQCFALDAKAWGDSGGFDESFPSAAGEDRDFCVRWRANGLRLRRLANATYVHDHALDMGAFLRKHREYGTASTRFTAQARPARGRLLAGLFRQSLAARPWTCVPGVLLAVGLSQIAAAVGRMQAREQATA